MSRWLEFWGVLLLVIGIPLLFLMAAVAGSAQMITVVVAAMVLGFSAIIFGGWLGIRLYTKTRYP